MACYEKGGCKTCPGREVDFCQPGNQLCPAEGLVPVQLCQVCGKPATRGLRTGRGDEYACDSCMLWDDTGNMEVIPV